MINDSPGRAAQATGHPQFPQWKSIHRLHDQNMISNYTNMVWLSLLPINCRTCKRHTRHIQEWICHWPRPWQMTLGFTGFLSSKLRGLVKLIRVACDNNWRSTTEFLLAKKSGGNETIQQSFMKSEKAPPNIYLPNCTNTFNTSKESLELQLGVLQLRNMWGGNEEKSYPIPPRNPSILQVESCIIKSCLQDRFEMDVDRMLETHQLYRIWFRGSGLSLLAQHAGVLKCQIFQEYS